MSLQTHNGTVTEAEAEGWLPKTCFKNGPPGRIGIELEYIVHTRDHEHLPPYLLRRLHDDLAELPLDSRFTTEPGGQVELSSRPADSLGGAVKTLEEDLALVTEVVARHGARLVGRGIDPLPPPPRLLDAPRYVAMDEHLSRWGRAGAAMMRSTASVQVNVETGPNVAERWGVLHRAGPVLSAAFATSTSYPAADPQWAGWAGLRQAVWQHLDPSRCRAPVPEPGETVPEAWARWVLDAEVFAIRRPDGDWSAPPGLTFRRWIREGNPTLDDLAYHLTTLFPPVRARGHLEVRYLDAQPGRWWRVPAAVISVLTDDIAGEACEHLTDWRQAARVGLCDPEIQRAARTVLTNAAEALDRAGDPALAELTDEYLERPHLEEPPC